MSANDNFNESPNHFIVLDAISSDITNLEKVARATKLHNDEVESIVNDLLTQRLIVKGERKGFIFGRKKIEVCITEIGSKLLNAKKQELEQKRQRMQQSYDNGDGTQLQSYMDSYRMWIPMMLFSGIMDMMFFTSMMSFMGLGINPIESAIIGNDSGHHDAGAIADGTHSVHDHSGIRW
ncbi:MAG: MarR family transcriptional regulator [Thermoproteota archaeon]|nr:MarR family transcriptional regulator [Thermoproteota archaeon]